MRSNWWRFWNRAAWSIWRVERRAWTAYRAEAGRLRRRHNAVEAGLKSARTDLDRTDTEIRWLEALAPREVPVKTARTEVGLAEVAGVRLMETRKRQGVLEWTPVDVGTLYFTDRKMVFSGSKDVEFRFDKISTVARKDLGLHVVVSTRKRDHVLTGPTNQLEAVLVAARGYQPGADPAAEPRVRRAEQTAMVEAHEAELADLHAQLTGLERPRRPMSPIWVPVGVVVALGVAGSFMGDQEPTGAATSDHAAASALTGGSPTTLPLAATTPTTTTTAPMTTTTSSVLTTATTTPEAASPDDSAPSTTTSVGAVRGVAAGVPESAVVAAVLSITDGDTIRVRLPDSSEEPLRLIGINAPEGGECLADAATDFLAERLGGGADIGLVSDVSDRDQFDRLLRYVYVDGALINEEIVGAGLAVARRYEPDTAFASVLEAAQTAAQDARVGMWAPAACGSVSQASVAIGDVAYDAPGNDNKNLNEEWITITNTGSSAADLTGWQVKDESASHRYSFPAGFSLSAGASVILHSGCGTDSPTRLYWCNTGSAIWNNSGDTVFLLDPQGNIIAFYAYDESTPSATPNTPVTSAPPTTTTVAPTGTDAASCHPSYLDVCIPPPPPDLDCGEITFRRFKVIGSDPHRFDGDSDGIGCESG